MDYTPPEKSRQPIHMERLIECKLLFFFVWECIWCTFLPLADIVLLKCFCLSCVVTLHWPQCAVVFSCVLTLRSDPSSKPVPSDCPEHRGVQEVPVGWGVSGLPRKTGCDTAGNQYWSHHLPLAVHAHTQIWTGWGKALLKNGKDTQVKSNCITIVTINLKCSSFKYL